MENFLTCGIREIRVGEPLPCDLFVYLDFKFILYRAKGEAVSRVLYERLELKKVKHLFIRDMDREAFGDWSERHSLQAELEPPLPPNFQEFKNVRDDVHRRTLDVFSAEHPDKRVAQTLEASKKLVAEVMKFPYAVQTLKQLQTYSQGTVDHSVNVSILSVYLALQMGYAHNLILQHVGMGGLLHDIGKTQVKISESDSDEIIEKKMREHPALGLKMLEGLDKVPMEVKMIVAQHHELHDGSGYPKQLRGNAIYDLARIVCLANVFDELVGDSSGKLAERQKNAIVQIDQVLFRKFDPQKLDKAIKILKLGV